MAAASHGRAPHIIVLFYQQYSPQRNDTIQWLEKDNENNKGLRVKNELHPIKNLTMECFVNFENKAVSTF